MKAFLFSALVATALTATAQAADHAQLATQAKAEYAQREYDNNGIHHAQAAADLYDQAASAAPDATTKAGYLISKSEALFFVGDATEQRDIKIDRLLKGKEAGDAGLNLLGFNDIANLSDSAALAIYNKLNDTQKALVGEGLYQRGINLGQWGAANGVVESLSKWPELRRGMELIETIGQKQIHEYGSYRVLGRGYFKIPSLLGGNIKKATQLLQTAVNSTKASNGAVYSKNGFNNVYYAEILKENGDDDQAEALLKAYIKADPNSADFVGQVPETKQNQRAAAELLKSW